MFLFLLIIFRIIIIIEMYSRLRTALEKWRRTFLILRISSLTLQMVKYIANAIVQ